MAEHLSQTLKLIETLTNKVLANERKIQEGSVTITPSMSMASGMYSPNYAAHQSARNQEPQQPPHSPTIQTPTTLEGQLLRSQISQSEYDWASQEADPSPLQGKSKELRDSERELRNQHLLDRIQARREETAARVARAVQEAKEGEPFTATEPTGISRAAAQQAQALAQENFTPMGEAELLQMERNAQSPETTRRKRAQSEPRENKKQHIAEDPHQTERTYSDGSTFVESFLPPEDTIQSQMQTDALNSQIQEAEEARTRQRQVELSQGSSDEDMDLEETIERMTQPEEDSIPTVTSPGAMTEADLDRNESTAAREAEEASPPARRPGMKP